MAPLSSMELPRLLCAADVDAVNSMGMIYGPMHPTGSFVVLFCFSREVTGASAKGTSLLYL